ncbi:4902_t:CDS:2, partial [Funneliformis caledonium]
IELANGLPNKQKTEVKRLLISNDLKTGFDLAEPVKRQTINSHF